MQDTIVAQSTPMGESALAVVRTSGPLSDELVRGFSGRDEPPSRQATLVSYRTLAGERVDEVVVILYEEGRSYTGEPMLEIMPHGNPLICQMILEDLRSRGCRLAEPGEFTRRAYLNGRLSLTQAEAVADVIHAQSRCALEVAQRHLSGEAGKLIDRFVGDLVTLRAEVEAYIDFPEEDLPPEDQEGPIRRLAGILESLQAFRRASDNRRLVQDGVQAIILGAPNAGKSSLLNALVGHARALVDAQAGTTRDYIMERLWIGPYLVNLHDTAGLHERFENRIEHQGIQRTIGLLDRADFVLVVMDSSDPGTTLPPNIVARLDPERTLVVENKVDLDASEDMRGRMPGFAHVRISALTGAGMETFERDWIDRLKRVLETRDAEGLMFNARQAQFIANAGQDLEAALGFLKGGGPAELAAFHLIQASNELIEINREIDNEQVLDALFAHFCIGK